MQSYEEMVIAKIHQATKKHPKLKPENTNKKQNNTYNKTPKKIKHLKITRLTTSVAKDKTPYKKREL